MYEPYPCDSCQHDPKMRLKLRCTRIDLDNVRDEWCDDKKWRQTPHMGRRRLPVLPNGQKLHTYQGQHVNPDYPPEDMNDGCPGGWLRVPLVWDVYDLIRKRTSDGNRVQNPMFDRADEWMQRAAMYFEQEQDALHGYWQKLINEQHDRDRKTSQVKSTPTPMPRTRKR